MNTKLTKTDFYGKAIEGSMRSEVINVMEAIPTLSHLKGEKWYEAEDALCELIEAQSQNITAQYLNDCENIFTKGERVLKSLNQIEINVFDLNIVNSILTLKEECSFYSDSKGEYVTIKTELTSEQGRYITFFVGNYILDCFDNVPTIDKVVTAVFKAMHEGTVLEEMVTDDIDKNL